MQKVKAAVFGWTMEGICKITDGDGVLYRVPGEELQKPQNFCTHSLHVTCMRLSNAATSKGLLMFTCT